MAHTDSRTIANWFIRRSKRDHGRALSNMQLQKLVYFAHGWSLGLHQQPLTRDEVQAWEFGPVIPKLYRSLARWGADPVTVPIDEAPMEALESYEEDLLEQVYQAYGHRPASILSALTHQRGTPWEKVFQPGERNVPIENEVIADHFADLAARAP